MLDRIQASELQIVVLAIALTPVMAWAYRGVDRPGKSWLAAAITAMGVSYVTTVIEGFVWADLFNHLEHLSIAVSAFCFVAFAVAVLKWQRENGAEEAKR